jgi:hypothetical protein
VEETALFARAIEEIRKSGGEVVFYPTAKWVLLSGAFLPQQLRLLADELDKRNGDKT